MGNIYNWSQGVYNAYFDDLLIKIQKSLKEVQLKQKKNFKMSMIIPFNFIWKHSQETNIIKLFMQILFEKKEHNMECMYICFKKLT